MTHEQKMARLWTMAERGLVGQMSDANLSALNRWCRQKEITLPPADWIGDEIDQRLAVIANIRDVARKIDPWAAQVAMATILTMLGSEEDWGSGQLGDIGGVCTDLVRETILPEIGDQDEAALEFWVDRKDW